MVLSQTEFIQQRSRTSSERTVRDEGRNRKLNHRSVQQFVCDAKSHKTRKDGKQRGNKLDESKSIHSIPSKRAPMSHIENFISKPLRILCTYTHKTRHKMDARWMIYLSLHQDTMEIAPASGVRFAVPGEVVADLQPWRGCTTSAVEESCQDMQKPFMQRSCLLEHISKSNEILSMIKPFQQASSPNMWFGRNPTARLWSQYVTVCHSMSQYVTVCHMSQCHQETTRHLPVSVGFPGAVGETIKSNESSSSA